MIKRSAIRGVYGITSPSPDMYRHVEQALRGGVKLLQYREKQLPYPQRREQAVVLKELCRQYSALFLVNDDLELALDIDADGVHLGKNDGDFSEAKARLGERIVGVSCYNDLGRARLAQAQGADYVAFGRFFPSRTKPDAVQANVDIIAQAKAELDIPVVVIGGITPENTPVVAKAGADAIAVIDGLFGQGGVEGNARAYATAFELAAAHRQNDLIAMS